MKVPQRAYKVNAPRVVYKTIAGETIIIDLQSGAYYTTEKAGTAIWEQIASGVAVERVTQSLQQRYSGDPQVIDRAVVAFIAELEQISLISPLPQSVPPGSTPSSDASQSVQASRPNFETPVLHKYTDMQDLLLVDPIHEVGAEGLPGVRQADPPVDELS